MDKHIELLSAKLAECRTLAQELADIVQPKPEWNDEDYSRKDLVRKPYETVIIHIDFASKTLASIGKPEPRCHTCNQPLPERMK